MIIGMPPSDDFTHHSDLGVDVITPQTEGLLNIIEVNRIGGELGLASELKARHGRLVLANAERIDPLLKITRARDKFTIAPDVIKAMEMFRE